MTNQDNQAGGVNLEAAFTDAQKRVYDNLAAEGGATWATYMMIDIEAAFAALPAAGATESVGLFWRWASDDKWRMLGELSDAALADFVGDQEKIAPVVVARLFASPLKPSEGAMGPIAFVTPATMKDILAQEMWTQGAIGEFRCDNREGFTVPLYAEAQTRPLSDSNIDAAMKAYVGCESNDMRDMMRAALTAALSGGGL